MPPRRPIHGPSLALLAPLLCALFALGCQPAEDPAARDASAADSAPEADGSEPEPEPDRGPDDPDASPDPEPDGGPGDPDASPDPEPDGGPDPDLGPDMAPVGECGDGTLDEGEACDDGPANSDEAVDACRTDCQPARCGDGVIDSAELCDGDRTCDPETCLPACADDCPLDAAECADDGVRTCGDFDGDPCWEWSPSTACGADEACVDGACACVDLCEAGAADCADDSSRRDCLPQPNGCLGWSEPVACDVFEGCTAGACQPLPPPPVLINEVLYDAPGADRPGVFIELWGPPGTPLDGLTVVGINGNGGAQTGVIALAGAIPDDGYYVIAHTDANPDLAALADQLDRAADLQNGPDSVQLVRGPLVIDALGYGDFADAVFAGEGQPAVDVAELSLTRGADHSDTDDNFTDFRVAAPTPRADPPDACEDACDADAIRCAGDAIERCLPDPDGCLSWHMAEPCPEAQLCQDGICQDRCEPRCDPDADGDRCAGEFIEACVPDADGCPDWQRLEDCEAAELTCIDGACAPTCEDACVDGALRCVGDAVERCQPTEDCLEWRPAFDCAEAGQTCLDGACLPAGRCGDGVVDPDEACDDGNLDLGDGCDDACTLEDAFDQRAALVVRPPPPGERPAYVPGDLAQTTYARGLRHDNSHYFVFEAFDDSIRDLVAEVPIGRGIRLEPGDYAVVINDTYQRVIVDWNDRVEIRASRLEVQTNQPGYYTARPPRRFDDIARDLPLRGCGPFGNQVRSPWLFGGCDGDLGGGAIALDTGLVVLPATYRIAVEATYHSPNATFVEARPGELGIYTPADTRARIEVLSPPPGDLPDFELTPMPNYGTANRRVGSGNGRYHIFRFLGAGDGWAYIATGSYGQPAVVPAGRYYVTMNDSHVVHTVVAGELLQIPSGRIQIPGDGAYDVLPDDDVRRFTWIDNQQQCSRQAPETYLLVSCAAPREGVFPRGTAVDVLPGTYEVYIYGADGGLLQTQPFEVLDPAAP